MKLKMAEKNWYVFWVFRNGSFLDNINGYGSFCYYLQNDATMLLYVFNEISNDKKIIVNDSEELEAIEINNLIKL